MTFKIHFIASVSDNLRRQKTPGYLQYTHSLQDRTHRLPDAGTILVIANMLLAVGTRARRDVTPVRLHLPNFGCILVNYVDNEIWPTIRRASPGNQHHALSPHAPALPTLLFPAIQLRDGSSPR